MTFDFRQDVIGFFIEEVSEEEVEDYIEELLDLFESSPEGQAYLKRDDVEALMWADIFVDFAINYLRTPLWLLRQQDVREILYDIFPAKTMCKPEEAQKIVDELRVFWEFVKREFKEQNAGSCLKIFNEKNIVKRLSKELGDASKFGMAKMVMMPGLEAGLDLTDEAAIQAYLEEYNEKIQAEMQAPLPEKISKKRDEVIEILKSVCEKHLKEYLDYALEIADIISMVKPESPYSSGQAKSWAAGIVYALGNVNFLFDPNNEPYLSATDLCKLFGVSQSTASSKAKEIKDGLGLYQFHPDWTIETLLDENPLVWMLPTQDGLIMDIRHMPREVQEKAFENGLIPYIPADKDKKDKD